MTKENDQLYAPDGYALVSIEALKEWGKYEFVRDACQYPCQEMVPLSAYKKLSALCTRQGIRLMELEDAQPEKEPVALTDDERKAFERFNETCEDGEGYDVPKQMMKRLAEIGVVHHTSAGIYGITEYGHWMLGYRPPQRNVEQAMRLYKAVERLSLQAGEETDETIDYLCGEHGGMAKLFEAYFSPKPPQRKPLTRKQIDEMADDGCFLGNVYEITREVEAEHGIKE